MSFETTLPDEVAERRRNKHAAFLSFAEALLRASRGEKDPASATTSQFVTFVVRDRELGIPILQCREVVRVATMTRIPEAPAHVRGVVNLRGRVLPVVDMRRCLGFEALQPTSKARLVVAEVGGRFIALLVDRVSSIVKVASADIAPPTADAFAPALGSAWLGIAQTRDVTIHLFDVERMLCSPLLSEASAPKE